MSQRRADAATIQGQEFDHPFTIYPDGILTDAGPGIYAPDVTNDPAGDVEIGSSDWQAMVGLTNQWSYHGAVMHPSEFVGEYIAAAMRDHAHDAGHPVTFAIVEVRDEDGQHSDGDPIGWAIVYTS